MAEANMIDVFNSKVLSFNKALREQDVEVIGEIGAQLLDIALDELSNPNLNGTIRSTYVKQAKVIKQHLANLHKYGRSPNKVGNDSAGEASDPYYVEKQWFSDDVPALNFTNIIGVQEVKDAFMVDVVAPLRPEFRDIYRKFRGSQLGSQILLYGPPGTGKTHIVKCLAGALNCKIAVVQTSEVLASVVGVAEKNVRDIFAQASQLDRCIIFLDEIDSICSDRDSIDSRNTKSILTTLLTCMDGFVKTTKENQLRIIVAATNLPWKLDSALKRGGRFETQIYVPLPDMNARLKFAEDGLSNLPHEDDVTSEYLANVFKGYSGADIKAMIRQIADMPLRRAILDIMKGNRDMAEQERVTLQDCEHVVGNYINSITPEMLLRFEAYDKGITLEELLKTKRD
ncbi:MAG: ATP-binding protein [Christensenellales bacterium]